MSDRKNNPKILCVENAKKPFSFQKLNTGRCRAGTVGSIADFHAGGPGFDSQSRPRIF